MEVETPLSYPRGRVFGKGDGRQGGLREGGGRVYAGHLGREVPPAAERRDLSGT